ncbi:MAG TPA: hypothetical protein VED40_14985 [Azospirillaceae bacterium]|nr:hypothetical protein [Azospirillaceae bacterium]
MDDPTLEGPPSGLLTRSAWERELEAGGRLPAWYWRVEERERRFADWVEAAALGMAAQLGRLNGPNARGDLLGHAAVLSAALLEDAAWARDMRNGKTTAGAKRAAA